MLNAQAQAAMTDAVMASARILADAAERCGLTPAAFGAWAASAQTRSQVDGAAAVLDVQAQLVQGQLQLRALQRLGRILDDRCAKIESVRKAATLLLTFNARTNTFRKWMAATPGNRPALPHLARPAPVNRPASEARPGMFPGVGYCRPNLAVRSSAAASPPDKAAAPRSAEPRPRAREEQALRATDAGRRLARPPLARHGYSAAARAPANRPNTRRVPRTAERCGRLRVRGTRASTRTRSPACWAGP